MLVLFMLNFKFFDKSRLTFTYKHQGAVLHHWSYTIATNLAMVKPHRQSLLTTGVAYIFPEGAEKSIWVPGQVVKPYTNMQRLTTMIENLSLDKGEEEPTLRDNTSLEVKGTWKPGGGPQRHRHH